MDDWSRLFFLYWHNWEDWVAEDFQWQLFSSLCHWLSDTRGMHTSSPAFIPNTFPPNGDFGSVQVRGRLQYVLLMSSTACIEPGERALNYCDATNPLLLKTRARKSKDDIWSALILHSISPKTSVRTSKKLLPNIPLGPKIRPKFLDLRYILCPWNLSLSFLCRGNTFYTQGYVSYHLSPGSTGAILCPTPCTTCTLRDTCQRCTNVSSFF